MALIDLDKFVASFITEMKECSQMRNFSIPRCIKKALVDQGLEYKDGEIVKSQRRVSAEAKENGYGESEDERIRKALIKFHKSTIDVDGIKGEDIIDWLEKQGENKPIVSNDALREGIANFGITQYQIDNWLKKYVDVEKQGEQKPADKAEPKFKVCDIIKPKDGGHESWQIMQVDILDKKYRFKEGYVIHFSQEDDYELVEQKPTWSEEDERMYRGLHNLIYSTPYCDSRKELSDWLKSLKQRIGG
jgi:hypothetical protein